MIIYFHLIINGLKQRPISDVLNGSSNLQPVRIDYKTPEGQVGIQNENISESKGNSNKIDEHGKYKSSSLKDDDKIKGIVNVLLKYESSLRTGNFHKKSYFEGSFNFLKFSDA